MILVVIKVYFDLRDFYNNLVPVIIKSSSCFSFDTYGGINLCILYLFFS